MTDTNNENPLFNCHTHIFTGEHVPPYLAKTFIISPIDRLLSTPRILKLAKWYRDRKNKKYLDPHRERYFKKRKRAIWLHRNFLLRGFLFIIALWVTLHALFIALQWLGINDVNAQVNWKVWIGRAHQWLLQNNLLLDIKAIWLQIVLVGGVLLFIKSGRNLLWFVFKNSLKILRMLPGKMARDLIDRYMLMGRFAMYQGQAGIFERLKDQYPEKTKFIVLPMDMDYMDAGEPKVGRRYPEQLEELAIVHKKNPESVLPFVFADPRRIAEDPNQFRYEIGERGEVLLKDCFIKTYIEDKGFSGFKIYPALGYYPFDEKLLPLWLYAADRQIPIMTHCIKGSIFYRGKKKREWDQHPVFKEYVRLGGDQQLSKLLLPQRKNAAFSCNFTHPLNYLVLLKEELLRIWVGQCSEEIKILFGYTDPGTRLARNLEHLKICFAHFGGEGPMGEVFGARPVLLFKIVNYGSGSWY